MNLQEIRTFRDLRASMTPVMWARAIFLVMVLAACALVGLAVVLTLILWSIQAAVDRFEHWDTGALITILHWGTAHSWT